MRSLLLPFSWAYQAAIAARNARFDRGGDVHRAPFPVISVGNITTGGTGKTPFVIEVVRRLRALGRKPAILTRGYAAKSGQTADEVLEFQQELPDVPVVVNADRVGGARSASADHRADCAVLDDGFQHRRLARELDIVLIDALNPWGGGQLLPAGNLREPLTSLSRAGLIVLTRANQVPAAECEALFKEIRTFVSEAEILRADVAPLGITTTNGATLPSAELAYRGVMPVCGVGNPRSFLAQVQSLAGHAVAPMIFRDHHRYTPRDARRILSTAMAADADLVLVTRKDWVKLAALWMALDAREKPDLARLDMRLEVRDPASVLDRLLRQALENLS